jgi:hypothetical protein
MSDTNKQIYIPNLGISGNFIEELGSAGDRLIYPGKQFSVTLSEEDFENPEDYHTTWINITKAVKSKLEKNASQTSS